MAAIRFISLLFTALALVPALAHALELPNKINLSSGDYLTVQQLYRGWALLGIVEFTALLSTLILTILAAQNPRLFGTTLAALLCISAALVVFFLFTYPANQQTNNWTEMPANWQYLREQWEYSHASRAAFFFTALVSLLLPILKNDQ